jgi:hypothetical protein
VGLSAPSPIPGYHGRSMISVRVVSHSWLVPILKRRNKWYYSCFVNIHLSARYIPSRPHISLRLPWAPKT